MNDGFKIGVMAGVGATAIGLALQNTQDPMLQGIGQTWLLGGVAASGALTGLSALSTSWNKFKSGLSMERSIERLENINALGPATNGTVVTFVELAITCADAFEQARDLKRSLVAERLQMLGNAIADNVPGETEQAKAAELVHNAMNLVRLKLDQMSPYANFEVRSNTALDGMAPEDTGLMAMR